MSQGLAAVADRLGTRLALFDSTGTLIRHTGRRGEGPGEFQDPATVVTFSSDSLAVWDPRLQRMTIFSARGELAETIRIGDTRPFARAAQMQLVASLPGQRFLFSRNILAPPTDHWLHRELVVVDRQGRILHGLGRYRLAECVPDIPSCVMPLFGGFGIAAAQDSVIVAASTDQRDIRVVDDRGELLGTIRRHPLTVPTPPEPVGHGLPAVAQQMPTFADLVVDACGLVWIEPVTRPRTVIQQAPGQARYPPRETRWEVYRATGERVGAVAMPPVHEVLHIGRDRMVAGSADAHDVLRLEIYTLDRGGMGCPDS